MGFVLGIGELVSRDVGSVRPRVVGYVNDNRSVGIVTSEEDWSGVQSTVDETVYAGNSWHSDSDVLVLLQDGSSLECSSESGTVGVGISGVGRSVDGDDGIDVSLGNE